ncbi:hypothetical protein CTZ27_28405 [Streptomyces griseocarneus]|nr:hypothetical protein CTZ27_28405 [Streptomyces griseocarneus]
MRLAQATARHEDAPLPIGAEGKGGEWMDIRRRGTGKSRTSRKRRGWASACHAVALALVCAGVVTGPAAAAPAAAAADGTAACATDPGAQGLPSVPRTDSLVSVDRADGRIAQFQLFNDSTATPPGLPFVWHREQDAPGGAYGPWERVSAATVGPKSYFITAVENSAGNLELLFSTNYAFCHTVEDGNGGWTAPDAFGLAPGAYHGGAMLFKERDGSIDAFASSPGNGTAMQLRHQDNPDDGWGPVRSTGALPDPYAGLGEPTSVEQLPDGRLHLTAQEWNRLRYWEISQTAPGGDWGPWRLRSPQGTPAPRAVRTTGPRLDVRRTTGLLDGDIVEFTIAGGPPKDRVWVKQCGPSASVPTCDNATGRQFRVYPDGTYAPSPKKLYARLTTAAGNADCRTVPSDDPCSLALTDNTGALLTTVPLRFTPHGRMEPPPTFDVDPDKGLVDGQAVHVTGEGYEPQYHVPVMQCATSSADTFDCRPRSRPPGTGDDGRVDETVILSATFTSINNRTVDCRTEGACELVAFDPRVHGPALVRHPLSFAPATG